MKVKYRIDKQTPFMTNFVSKEMPVLHIDSACHEQLLEQRVAL